MNTIINISVVFLAAVAFCSPAAAQKLYKIIDDEGNVTFSQFPPQEKQENATIDEHTVFGGSQSTVSERGDYMYCGDVRLASKNASGTRKSSYVENLESKRTEWMRSRDRLSRRIDETNQAKIKRDQQQAKYQSRYGSSNSYSSSHGQAYLESIERDAADLRDIKCAIAWADDELEGSRHAAAINAEEIARLEAIREELQGRMDRYCGELPKYDPSDSRNSERRKGWYDCSVGLRKEIKRVDSALADL